MHTEKYNFLKNWRGYLWRKQCSFLLAIQEADPWKLYHNTEDVGVGMKLKPTVKLSKSAKHFLQ